MDSHKATPSEAPHDGNYRSREKFKMPGGYTKGKVMFPGILLWLLGVPLVVVILLYVLNVL
jgi:hypothetical protein